MKGESKLVDNPFDKEVEKTAGSGFENKNL
jgi:hypothetical protein